MSTWNDDLLFPDKKDVLGISDHLIDMFKKQSVVQNPSWIQRHRNHSMLDKSKETALDFLDGDLSLEGNESEWRWTIPL